MSEPTTREILVRDAHDLYDSVFGFAAWTIMLIVGSPIAILAALFYVLAISLKKLFKGFVKGWRE